MSKQSLQERIQAERLGLCASTEGGLRSVLAAHGMTSYKDILGEELLSPKNVAQPKVPATPYSTPHYSPYYDAKFKAKPLKLPLKKAIRPAKESGKIPLLKREDALEPLLFDTDQERMGSNPDAEALIKHILNMQGISLETLFPALCEQIAAQAPRTFRR
jgi:hypothetical protein